MNTDAYLDISAWIRATAPWIKDIDIYNEQYENSGEFEEYQYPAVYIEWLPNAWNNNNDDSQQGLGGFILHVVVSVLSQNTRNLDLQPPGDAQQKPLIPFNIHRWVHKSVNNKMPRGFITPLERIGDEPGHNYGRYWVNKLKYPAYAIDDDTNIYNTTNWTEAQIVDAIAQAQLQG